jgi:hypothetical protein
MNPEIWGPPYWFFLHTISLKYPLHPNATIKKKYYEFFKTLPDFLPSHSNRIRKLMEVYPVVTYLDTREHLIKYVHLLHNKINKQLDKPEISLEKFYHDYYDLYHPKHSDLTFGVLRRLVYSVFLILFMVLIYKLLMG